MSTVWEQLAANARLVSLPDVYLRLRSVLDDPNSNLADVADVVGKDPAMTTRLLRIVNSAYFGLGNEIDTVSRAVGLLGTQEVHDLVLAASVAKSFEGMSSELMDMQRFWRQGVRRAIIGSELAVLCNVLDGERLFVAGLLSDIGHLYIYQLAPQKAQQAIELAQVQGMPLYKAEQALLGTDYARVGGELMRRWQLPQSLWEPTEFQVEPTGSQEYELFTSLVHIAIHLADGADKDLDTAICLAGVWAHAWEVTGLSAAQCGDLSERIESQVDSVTQLMFPAGESGVA
jgi:HD-like signal output (HDOD) protein